jgi:hypothetical protein
LKLDLAEFSIQVPDAFAPDALDSDEFILYALSGMATSAIIMEANTAFRMVDLLAACKRPQFWRVMRIVAAGFDVLPGADGADFLSQRATGRTYSHSKASMLRPRVQCVVSLFLVACIVVIVYSPFVDLPLTVHTTVHSRAVRPVQVALVLLTQDFQTSHSSFALETARQVAFFRSKIAAITCSLRC